MTRATRSRSTTMALDLQGLRPAPSQVWGAVRLVPLIRDVPLEDLRLGLQSFAAPVAAVAVDGTVERARTFYHAFIPYALVVSWTTDGQAVVNPETWVGPGEHAGATATRRQRWVLDRMIKRVSHRSVRMLPLHVAMEGFLSLYFAGPEIAWRTWSEPALRHGLSPRVETALPGAAVPDLGDALRLFEIHHNQCGVLVFVGDSFASGFVVPHPDDYRALHPALLQDFYAELLEHHGWHHRHAPAWQVRLDDRDVTSLRDLEAALERGRHAWAQFDAGMATGLVGREVQAQPCSGHGPYTLHRFTTGFEPAREQHIGEIMRHSDGTVAYLKTYRLMPDQRERGRLLETLARNDWAIERAASDMGQTRSALEELLVRRGFGDLLRHPGKRR